MTLTYLLTYFTNSWYRHWWLCDAFHDDKTVQFPDTGLPSTTTTTTFL